ncbi:VOC family protein [Shewanella sp. WXL01]|uniref:VOC family protein n=1 Tax=Shewanella sp. WXL01 TaxID=2709721 RepID=UPI00143867BE|nr:VOC family protein [Shewanella sp. WXL01]NKF49921.1 VOC family protein [Shewanella sp. WXL01]
MASLQRIDHIHIYVSNREQAVDWYQQVLDFHVIEALRFWSKDGGPLTIKHDDIHLALFESEANKRTTVAFGVSAEDFLAWQTQLNQHNVVFKEYDHDLSWSIYFSDPFANPFEITTYEYDEVKALKAKLS